MSFPTFDLSEFENATGSDRRKLAVKVDRICRKTGFLVLTGHGVSDDVIALQWAGVKSFFSKEAEFKRASAAPYIGYPYGYLGPDKEALAKSLGVKTPPDLKESFNGGPLSVPAYMTDPDALAFCYMPTLWPDLPDFKRAWSAYYAAMEDLATRIMTAFAAALDLPDDFFAPSIADPVSALRALHYPATTDAFLERQQRAGAHSDFGSLSILLPQSGSTGLQIAQDDYWIDVPAPEGAFIVNIGDLMARWTADRWVSTVHRVVARSNEPARQSLAFFHQPDWDADIAPLDGSEVYPSVKAGPYLMSKFKSTGA
jgi:isopenicillin N synthase-like dioxygenase